MYDDFLAGLPDDVARRVNAAGDERHYPVRSYLFHTGEAPSGVLLVKSGLLRVDRTTQDGRIVLFELEMPGCLVGELAVIDGAPRSATISTAQPSVVRFIPSQIFRSLMDDEPALKDAVLHRVVRRLRELSGQMVETSTMDASSRIAGRLVRLIDKDLGVSEVGGVIELHLPITQVELGEWCGLSREGVGKGLKSLRQLGIVDTNRKHMTVLDLPALRERAR